VTAILIVSQIELDKYMNQRKYFVQLT